MGQEFLPPAVQNAFLASVTEFVWLPWKAATQTIISGASQGGSQAEIQTYLYENHIPAIILTYTNT